MNDEEWLDELGADNDINGQMNVMTEIHPNDLSRIIRLAHKGLAAEAWVEKQEASPLPTSWEVSDLKKALADYEAATKEESK